ncbi:hypothetical protein CYMTET_45404, partial [Cymbomonas tetramitiformis]
MKSTAANLLQANSPSAAWNIVFAVKGAVDIRKKAQTELKDFERRLNLQKKDHGKNASFTVIQRLKSLCARPPGKRTATELLDICVLASVANPFFCEQPLELLKELCRTIEVQEAKPGATICQQGAIGDGMYIILQGAVNLQVETRGRISKVAKLPCGAYFGDTELITGKPRAASVIADGHTAMLKIDGDTFREAFPERARRGGHFEFLTERVMALGDIAPEHLTDLSSKLSTAFYKKDHVFTVDKGANLYFVKEGRLSLLKPMPPESCEAPASSQFVRAPVPFAEKMRQGSTELHTFTPGSYFGQTCAFPEQRQGWLVVADTDVEILQ